MKKGSSSRTSMVMVQAHRAFSLPSFIPLLSDRIYCLTSHAFLSRLVDFGT
jgi:hypothetical protein